MGFWAAAAPIIGGVAGGLGSKAAAKSQNRPQSGWSQSSPAGQLGGWNTLQNAQNRFTNQWSSNPNMGPTAGENMWGNRISSGAMNPFQIAPPKFGGVGIHEYDAKKFGGAGGWENLNAHLMPQLQGFGSSWKGFLKKAQGIQADPTQYEQDVLGGEYLDIAGRPEVQNMNAAIRQEEGENRGLALSQAGSPFAASAGTMGMSGANLASQRQVMDQSSENVANAIAANEFGLYDSERARQNEIDAILANKTNALVGAGASAFGSSAAAKAQLGSALAGATAQGYSSDNALAAALQNAYANAYGSQLQAKASGHATNAGLQAAYWNAQNQNNALNWQKGLDAYGANRDLGDLTRQNEMTPYQMSADYMNMINQFMQPWARTNTYGSGGGASPSGSFMSGALGGAMMGAGAYNNWGPGYGGGGGGSPFQSVYNQAPNAGPWMATPGAGFKNGNFQGIG